MHLTQQNQTLETNQLTNKTKNIINLDVPQINQPNLSPNKNNTPKFNLNFNHQLNPNFNANITLNTITQYSNTNTPVATRSGDAKVGLEPKRIKCPFCLENTRTEIHKSTNIKAFLIAIGTFYIGFVLIQTCKNKIVSCKDCEHTCPNCGHLIGKYFAM